MNDEEEETTLNKLELSSCLLTVRLSPQSTATASTNLIELNHGHQHQNNNRYQHSRENLLGNLIDEQDRFTKSKTVLETSLYSNVGNTTSDFYLPNKASTTMRHQRRPLDKSIVMQTTNTRPDEAIPSKDSSNHHHYGAGAQSCFIEKSALFDHLIKLAMFLMTIVCSPQTMSAVDCQKHHFQPHHHHHHHHHPHHQQQKQQQPTNHHQYLTSNEHLILNQQLVFDQLTRNSNNNNNNNNNNAQQLALPHRVHRQAADRRASASAVAAATDNQPAGSQKSHPDNQQAQQNDNGRLLVCYYTTRQSAPYWPKDAREYVIPPEGFSGQSAVEAALSQVNAAAPTAPLVHYEPLLRQPILIGNDVSSPQQAHDYGFNLSGLNQNAQNTKNQQQQLVFKSAAVPQTGATSSSVIAGGQSLLFNDKQQQQVENYPSSTLYNGINNSVIKSKQDSNLAFGELAAEQQQQLNNPGKGLRVHQHHQFDKPANKHNKQSSVYSFIGEQAEIGNNGLIVGADGGGSGAGAIVQQQVAPVGSVAQQAAGALNGGSLSQSGNNGNNFIISHNDGHNHNLQQQQQLQERNSMKQARAQQSVFSPSLSRAFIVGGPGNTNNEALDTKSHVFMPQQQQQLKHNNNNQFNSQQAVGSKLSSPKLYQSQQQQQQQQQQQHELLAQKAKSFQVTTGNNMIESLSPAQSGFSGTVSSAQPVPLSSASSALVVKSSVSPYRGFQQAAAAAAAFSQQQSAAAATTNHLIVSGAQQQQQINAQKSHTPVGGNNLSTFKQPNNLNSELTSANKALVAPLTAQSAPANAAASSPSATGTLLASGSSTSSRASSSSQQPSPGTVSNNNNNNNNNNAIGGLSSALVSSPLSTMFDVFGAASQYLMRFKPSSLMSPSSFAFNTISSDHLHHAAANIKSAHQHHNHNHALDNSSQIMSSQAALISPSALISAPFSPSSLMASLHKSATSSSSASVDDRSSSSSKGASGILSRFSLQSDQQRREDVCGKTIQTPQRRIIGGEGARYGEFPYQVHIKIAKHQCGGALVDKQSIVTAAHCVYHFITRAPVNKLQIVIGAYDIEDEQYQELPPQYFKVNKVKLHPNFRFSASHPDRYDIAILKLDKPVKYTDNVLPVCLPSRDLKFESMVGTVTGFGKTDPSLSNRYGTRLLQKVDVPIIENNECERWHRTRGIDLKIFPEMMCAGYEDGLKDACVGDSGGPLVIKTASGPNGAFRWTLAGITSAGFGCAQSRQPGIYHRVSHTVDWILDNLD